eukprot:jgi/Ulvmu1/7181/UM034_0090.1
MSSEKVSCLLNYYLRSGLEHSVIDVATILLERSPGDVYLEFWKAFGMYITGSVGQAIPVLRGFSNDDLVGPASLATLVHAANSSHITDSYGLAESLESERISASDEALLLLATVQWHCNELEAGLQTLDQLEDSAAPDNIQRNGKAVNAWMLLAQAGIAKDTPAGQHDDSDDDAEDAASSIAEAQSIFRVVLANEPSHIDSLMGIARIEEKEGDLPAALKTINEVHVKHSWFAPALMEKMHLSLSVHGWKETMECVASLQQKDATNAMAFAYHVIHSLVKEGSMAGAAAHMKDLCKAIADTQPRNAALMLRLAVPISRLACGDPSLLAQTRALVDRAAATFAPRPPPPALAAEAARQQLLAGSVADAARTLRALRVSAPSTTTALLTAEADALGGDPAAAAATVEAYDDTLDTAEERAHAAYVSALVSALSQPSLERAAAAIEAAVQAQLDTVQGEPCSLRFYEKLDPSRPVALVRILLERAAAASPASLRALTMHADGAKAGAGDAPSPAASSIGRCLSVLSLLTRSAPQLPALTLLAARGHYIDGAYDTALACLTDIVRVRPGDVEARLMQAGVFVARGRPAAAKAALDDALAHNFGIKAWPSYHVMLGHVLLAQAQASKDQEEGDALNREARGVLADAHALPGMRDVLTEDQRLDAAVRVPTATERADGLCLYALALHRCGGAGKQAHEVLHLAERLFEGQPEEVIVLRTSCELALSKRDVGAALKKLRGVPPASPLYRAARMAFAEITLRYRNDERQFIAAHVDIVTTFKDYDAHVSAGDAFLSIQEPERAVAMYQEALQLGAPSSALYAKLARTYAAMHHYKRALAESAKAVRLQPADPALRLEKTDMLLRMCDGGRATAELDACAALLQEMAEGSPEELGLRVSIMERRARIADAAGDAEGHLSHLTDALNAQTQLLLAVRGDYADVQADARERAATLARKVSAMHEAASRLDAARAVHAALLRACPGLPESALAVARLDLRLGHPAACEERCSEVLAAAKDGSQVHLEAQRLAARALFIAGEAASAISHLEALLATAPTAWQARAELLDCLRRAGRLDDAAAHMSAAANSPAAAGPAAAGFHYCRALLAVHRHEANACLQAAALARRDPAVAPEATLLMVQTYLQPLVDALWAGEATDASDVISCVSTCDALLYSLDPTERTSTRWLVLYHSLSLVIPDDGAADEALQALLDIARSHPDSVPVALAIATGYVKLGNIPRARTHLKRAQKMPYNPDDGEAFEAAWLLLATINVGAGKHSAARDFCALALRHNASAARAWDLQGTCLEAEGDARGAAASYTHAWRLMRGGNPAFGYRLAWNLLKSAQYAEAVDVALQVLDKFPDYPKIKEDVVDAGVKKLRAGSEREERRALGLLQTSA